MRLRKKRIEHLVNGILDKCGVTSPPVPVKRIAQSLGLEIQKQAFGDEVSGILIREGAKAIVGVNLSHHIHRQRFSIAHELGHFLLHEGDRIFIDRSYNVNLRSPTSSLGTDLEEIEANIFASVLLIPEQFLAKDLEKEDIDIADPREIGKIQRLAHRYRVSPQAMSLRLLNRIQ